MHGEVRMTDLSGIGEREIVRRLVSMFDPSGDNDLGDDTAILELGASYLLVTIDSVSARTHFPSGTMPEDAGWYSAAVNLSDIAAMGGQPKGMLFAIGLPKETDYGWLESFARGLHQCCKGFGVPILGGDTKENESLTVSAVAIGTVPKHKILRRSGARPGDAVYLTGEIGRGILMERDNEICQFLRFAPRLAEGQALAETMAVTSCIDLSDGLSTSLYHLMDASNIGFDIEMERIPFLPGLDVDEKNKSIHYGGDYELLFTVSPGMEQSLETSLPQNIFSKIKKIGYATEDIRVRLVTGYGTSELENQGYQHFMER